MVSVRNKPSKHTIQMDVSLAAKLGSIVVHVDELLSPDGRELDKLEIERLLQDVEVVGWVKAMGALLPVKRKR